MNARFVALVAGVFFFFLAVATQGILPFVEPSARTNRVTAVVRTDLGQLKWMLTEATDYTPLQELGRRVYLREGCWYCHSQYVRPVTGETRRWGPVSEAGEYAYDVPHLSRPFLESAAALPGFDHVALSGAVRGARGASQDRR